MIHNLNFHLGWREWFALCRGKKMHLTIKWYEMPSLCEFVDVTLTPPWGRAPQGKAR